LINIFLRLSISLRPSVTNFSNDGFSITAAEPWFKVKVQVIRNYLQSFVTNAAVRTPDIIVVDLFAGSGLYSVGHQKEIFAAACLSSLTTQLPISKWIFCEKDSTQAEALRTRVDMHFRSKNVIVLEDHPEELIDKLRAQTQLRKGLPKPAIFCLIDPFSLDIPFSLIDKLVGLGFSFLMPFTFCLNERQNYRYYLQEHREKVSRYLGGHVERLDDAQANANFYKRLVKQYQNNMLMLGLNTALSAHPLRSSRMELPVYYVGFFSKTISPKTVQRDAVMEEQLFLSL